jgi:hypothetical protein
MAKRKVAAASPKGRLELSRVIRELRTELAAAIAAGEGEALRFQIEKIELELEVSVEQSATGKSGVKFWILEAGVDGTKSVAKTQTLRIQLRPRDADGDEEVLISDDGP